MSDTPVPQPEPGALAPPPGEEALRSRRKLGCLIAAGTLSIAALLALPMVLRSRRGNPLFFATLNAGLVGRALSEFHQEYGSYPSGKTAMEVRSKTGSTLILSNRTSNGLFAQLLVSGASQHEGTFYAKARLTCLPDGVISTEAEILKSGECCFAYIVGLDSKSDPSTPIAFGPVNPGARVVDGSQCKGKAAVLRIDGSVVTLPVNSSGGIVYQGRDLLDPPPAALERKSAGREMAQVRNKPPLFKKFPLFRIATGETRP